MDFLSHLFLPLTAVYVIRRELFESPWMLGLAGFGLLSDFDKFLGMPGLLHSLVTLGPLCIVLLGVEYRVRDEFHISPVIVAFICSHLVLDFLDGGPVPLLFPLIDTGIGLQYPVQTVFGYGPLGITFEGPVVALRTVAPRPGNNTYGFLSGGGVASMLLFGLVYVSDRWNWMGGASSRTPTTGAGSTDQTTASTDDDLGRSESTQFDR